jgi:hypothetical protein
VGKPPREIPADSSTSITMAARHVSSSRPAARLTPLFPWPVQPAAVQEAGGAGSAGPDGGDGVRRVGDGCRGVGDCA